MVFTNNMKYFPKYSHHILLYYCDIFPSFYLQRGNECVFDKFLSLALIFPCCMTVLDYNTLKWDILHFFAIIIINKTKHTCQACVSVCSVAKSCLTLQPCRLQPDRLLCPWALPGKNTGVGCHFLLQEIFPTQQLNLRLLCLLH